MDILDSKLKNRISFIALLFSFIFITGCNKYKKKYEDILDSYQAVTKQLSNRSSEIERLNGELYTLRSEYESQVDAYTLLHDSYFRMTTDLVEINKEFQIIEFREEEIRKLKSELVDATLNENQGIQSHLAIEIKNKLKNIIDANKKSLERNKALVSKLENLSYDNEALQNAINLLKVELKLKDKLIANQQKQNEELELTIKRLNNKLNLQVSDCETLLANKDKDIAHIVQQKENIEIELDVARENIAKYFTMQKETNDQIHGLVSDTIMLNRKLKNCGSAIDSLIRINTEIPECAKLYYVIGSKDYLVSKGFLVKRRRKYHVNESVVQQKGNTLNIFFSSAIDIPSNQNVEIFHSKRKRGFEIINGKVLFKDRNIFNKDKYLVISYE